MVRHAVCDGPAFWGRCDRQGVHPVQGHCFRVDILLFPSPLALVRTVCIWGVREILVFVWEIVEEEGRGMVGKGNRGDERRIANDFGNLRDGGRRKVAVARHYRRGI